MVDKTKSTGHPLDRQNGIERAIQLEGPKDPDNFEMPDGRTLSDVRRFNQEAEETAYKEELQMVARTTREVSIAEFNKGEKLVVTKAGNIIDVTEPKPSENKMTMAESRTTMEDLEEGKISAPKERMGDESTRGSVETSTSSGQSTSPSPGPSLTSST